MLPYNSRPATACTDSEISGVFSAPAPPRLRFSVLTSTRDNRPTTSELDWPAFSAMFSTPWGEFQDKTDRDARAPLWNPATFSGGRKRANVEAVHALVLDIDGASSSEGHQGVPLSEWFRVLHAASPYISLAHTSFSHDPQRAINGEPTVCGRLVVLPSRPVLPHEWPAVRSAFVRFFGGISDDKTDDPTRCYFGPITRPGQAANYLVWRSDGMAGWDVDAALLAPAAPGGALLAPAPRVHHGGTPISREELKRFVQALARRKGEQEQKLAPAFRSVPEGCSVAAPGARDNTLFEMACLLAEEWPAGDPQSIADHFRLSLDIMAREAPGCPTVEDFAAKISRKQAEVHERIAERRAADARARTGRARVDLDGARLSEITDQVIAALAPLELFQRGGLLVHVVHDAKDEQGMIRPQGSPMIREVSLSRLRELVDSKCYFVRRDEDGHETLVPPSFELATMVRDRYEWSHIRPLEGIADFPVMLSDGSLLTEPGYDARTRLHSSVQLFVPQLPFPAQEHARRAAESLLWLVSDFPFENDAARSAWLAGLLTPLARPAIDGPTPLLLIDANARGAGKTLLAKLIGAIVLGRAPTMRTAPKTPEEWDKSLFSVLLAGDPIVVFDNCTAMLKSDALDACLTGTSYQARILGKSEDRSVPVRAAFVATSNNARASTDLVRRSLHCRLLSKVERPELMSGFQISDVLRCALYNRAELLSAAFTILRAYKSVGSPPVNARPMGSFEAWCRVVRDALVWAGCADPVETQDRLRESADVETDDLGTVLATLARAYGGRPFLASELVETQDAALKAALAAWVGGEGAPSIRSIGNKLRGARDVLAAGLVLQSAGRGEFGARWVVSGVSG